MEYAAGGELFTKLSNEGRMTEPEAKFIFAQIVSAVEHMVKYNFFFFFVTFGTKNIDMNNSSKIF